jgi:hypothetical protein
MLARNRRAIAVCVFAVHLQGSAVPRTRDSLQSISKSGRSGRRDPLPQDERKDAQRDPLSPSARRLAAQLANDRSDVPEGLVLSEDLPLSDDDV